MQRVEDATERRRINGMTHPHAMFVLLVVAAACTAEPGAGSEVEGSSVVTQRALGVRGDAVDTSTGVRGQPREAAYRAVAGRIGAQLEAAGVPGGALAIVERGQTRFVTGLGVKRAGKPERVDADTQFRIASTTKIFTAAAAVQLASEGVLSLDAPITRYVPSLRLKPPHDPASISLRALLSHTAGIPDYVEEECPAGPVALEQWFRAHPNLTLWSPPGRLYSYSNLGFALAGHVIERAAKKPFRQVIEDVLVAPLGLQATTFDTSEVLAGNYAAGHPSEGGLDTTTVSCGLREPHGFLWSSARDLARLAEVILTWGEGALDPLAIAQLLTPHTPTQDPPDTYYGLGMLFAPYRGVQLVGHGGDHPGYHAEWILAPEHGFGVVVLVNGDGYSPTYAASQVVDALLELPNSAPPNWSTPPSDWQRYVGVYRELAPADAFPPPYLGTWAVELEGDSLFLRELASGERYRADQVARDTWSVLDDGEYTSLTFWRDRTGRAEYIATREGVLRRVE